MHVNSPTSHTVTRPQQTAHRLCCFIVKLTVHYLRFLIPGHNPTGDRIWTYSPWTFPFPDNSDSLFTWCRTFLSFHHHHPPIHNVMQSDLIYNVRSVRVRSSGVRVSASFQIFALPAGDVVSGEGNCQGGRNVQRGNVLHSRRHNSIPYPNPYTTSYFMHMIAGN